MNKYQGLADWFANNYSPLNGWIYFNSNTMEVQPIYPDL